ncbi:hypothetical protein GCM10009827_015910 [Dactylosporangium maewongense]|uniref:Type I-U CRISPR-associated protein Cas5/Cas6 n=1 Tax=Dactylosporangium maewongense TaxID=634393 RepID=A0ABN1ZSW8_9ACTN
MTFTIVGELPIGTYRGAGPDGRPEPLPSVARLHAALLCAAGFGPRAVADGDGLAPCEADEVALRWLEEHPPDGVVVPALTVNRSAAVAYRDDGTVKKTSGVLATRKLPKRPDGAVAADGPFMWTWDESPPPVVRAALEALCPDVGYLGTSESPVRLRVGGGVAPTHELDVEAGPFTVGRVALLSPAPGRTDELVAAHRSMAVRPSVSRDRFGTDEKSLSPVPPRERVDVLRYAPRDVPRPAVPWDRVILLPLDRAIGEQFRVRWAVAAHQALIRLIGEGAPSLVTGVYPDGTRRPSNRLAIHLLDASMPVAGGLAAPSTLALLVPAGADAADLAVLSEAVANLRSLRGPRGNLARIKAEPSVVSGAALWAEPEAGYVRLWRTTPAAVPDTRGARDGAEWTFAHAALLSLGFVWKDLLPRVDGRGDVYYRRLAAAVTDAGAAAVHVRAVRATDVGSYVHRVNTHAVVRPYTAHLWLGDLSGAGTVAAIGQSRHLGGGLLVPFDVPDQTPLDAIVAADVPLAAARPGVPR